MNKRIQQFLAAENITQSQFADSINVARASVSHIIAGRNKPGFDFIENMARRYPSLNLEWLITGKGRMYKADNDDNTLFNDTVAETPIFASETPETPETVIDDLPEDIAEAAGQETPEPVPENIASSGQKPIQINSQPSCDGRKAIKKMIVLFSDGTYQELVGME